MNYKGDHTTMAVTYNLPSSGGNNGSNGNIYFQNVWVGSPNGSSSGGCSGGSYGGAYGGGSGRK
jgi:hypothetical protein